MERQANIRQELGGELRPPGYLPQAEAEAHPQRRQADHRRDIPEPNDAGAPSPLPNSTFAVTTTKIANNGVTNLKIALGADNTVKGTLSGATADITSPQLATLLGTGSGGGTTNFLRADGTWSAPPSGGSGTPSGPAGGSLTGTYPDPTLAANSVTGATIQNNAVGDSKLATMGAYTFKGNPNGTVLTPTSMSGTEATAMLDAFSSSLKGLAPASGGGTTNYLRADGTWAAPAGGGGGGTGTQSFTYTGAAQTFVVPTGVTSLTVDAQGAAGGPNSGAVLGGNGARVQGPLTVTPAETLQINIGQAGSLNGTATFGGGGACSITSGSGGSGGGASDIAGVPTVPPTGS